ncbi:hypothetical protein ADP71_40830 [Vitreoscilla sp. C1]|nr:hypothetical protein ADP71_40830 [Vitreoscilla sp. C1]
MIIKTFLLAQKNQYGVFFNHVALEWMQIFQTSQYAHSKRPVNFTGRLKVHITALAYRSS